MNVKLSNTVIHMLSVMHVLLHTTYSCDCVLSVVVSASQPSSILRTRAGHLEQQCTELGDDIDVHSAHKLNEYAVLLALFGDPRYILNVDSCKIALD